MEEIILFPSMVYREHMPQFLPNLRTIAKRYLDKIAEMRKLDEIYPIQQTWSFHNEPEALEFNQTILKASWDILKNQGYALDGVGVTFQAAWFQDHHKTSSMERHTHPSPAQLVGFYFIDVPEEEKTPWLVLDDPRPGKVQAEPFQKYGSTLQVASPRVSFRPREGDFFLTPAWLSHGLTRNASDKPFLMAHVNVMLIPMSMTDAAKKPLSPPAPKIL